MRKQSIYIGILSFNEGISLIKFPIMEEVQDVFLLYHMKIMPMAIVHTPVSTNRANMSFGDNENG